MPGFPVITPDPELNRETSVAALAAEYRQFAQECGSESILIRGSAITSRGAEGFEIPAPNALGSELLKSYLQARLFNLITIAAPQAIELSVPHQMENKALEAISPLMESSRNHGAMASIIERIYGTPFRIGINGRILIHQGFPTKIDTEQSSKLQQFHRGTQPTASELFARIRAVVIGIDLGGTDIKVAIADKTGLLLLMEHVWKIKPKEFHDAADFLDALKIIVLFALTSVTVMRMVGFDDLKSRSALIAESSHSSLQAMAELTQNALDRGIRMIAPEAIGISFPDVVIDNRVVGGLTSKYAGIRAKYQDGGGLWLDESGYWREFFADINPLAAQLSMALQTNFSVSIPVTITNDGTASSLWAAIQTGRPGMVGLSLGTSLAGGLVDETLQPYSGMFEIGNMIVFVGPKNYSAFKHTSLRFPGCAQQLLSQDTVFSLAIEKGLIDGYPRGREAATLAIIGSDFLDREPEKVQAIYGRIGFYLCLTLLTLRDAMFTPRFNTITLFGRVVSGPAGELIIHAAKELIQRNRLFSGLSDITLLRATDLATAEDGAKDSRLNALAQAIGAVYLAVLSHE